MNCATFMATHVAAASPLKSHAFRLLWTIWLSANICTWMSDLTCAWLMTSLTRDALLIAMVQSAASLPIFTLGIASGAFADIIDRRSYLLIAQWWVAAIALLLFATTVTGVMRPALLLVLTFANGVGMAMRWPVTAALTAELVPRAHVSAAVALNGVAMNASRVAAPAIAGLILAQAGAEWVFALNAVVSVFAGLALMRWNSVPTTRSRPTERLGGAILAGAAYVLRSARARFALVRCALFSAQAITLFALAPLIAMRFPGADARTYTLLLAAKGAGAILIAFRLAWLRAHWATDTLVLYGTLTSALATLVIAWSPSLPLAMAAMMAAGMAFVTVLNTLHVVAQLALPDRVRARGMAWVQMSTMGGAAAGAAIWGEVTTRVGLQMALTAAAVLALAGWLLTCGLRESNLPEEGEQAGAAS